MLDGRLFPVTLLLDGLSKGLAWLLGRPTGGSPGIDLLRATVGRAVLSVLVEMAETCEGRRGVRVPAGTGR